jgi:tRNA pseudouridine38-40 synthase
MGERFAGGRRGKRRRKTPVMTERTIKLILEYDGTDFHGWQKQPELRTVQRTVEEALATVTGEEIQAVAAGRTDAGVHATGQVCSFVCVSELPLERLRAALTAHLPPDIRVPAAAEMPASFHARFSARSRRYTYLVRTEPTALYGRFMHVCPFEFDVQRMRSASGYLLGERDFASFAASGYEERSTRCWMKRVEIRQSGALTSFHIEADRFLHKMVRTVVGTLLEVGRGRIPPERIEEIVCTRDRSAAGPTLPPQGLFLVEVVYE